MVRRVGIGVAVVGVSMLLFAAAASAGTISGRVTDEAGRPLAGITVCATAREYSYEGGCDWGTAADGTYAIEGLKFSPYYVGFQSPGGWPSDPTKNWAPQWYGGAAHPEESTEVSLPNGVAEGVDAVMHVGGQIIGKVTDRDTGRPLRGVEICPNLLGYFQAGEGTSCDRTDEGGEYDLRNLRTGEYRVEFRTDSGPDYIHENYASNVSVTEGRVTEDIDAALQPGLQIEGTVVDSATGSSPEQVPGMWGVSICALEPVTERRVGCTWHEGDGSYVLYGLPVGNYVIVYALDHIDYTDSRPGYIGYALPDGYVRQYWGGVQNFSEATLVGSPTPTVISGIDGSVSRGEEILPPGVWVPGTPGAPPPYDAPFEAHVASESGEPPEGPALPAGPGPSAAATVASPSGEAEPTSTVDGNGKSTCRKSARRVGKGRRPRCIPPHRQHPVGYHPEARGLSR